MVQEQESCLGVWFPIQNWDAEQFCFVLTSKGVHSHEISKDLYVHTFVILSNYDMDFQLHRRN